MLVTYRSSRPSTVNAHVECLKEPSADCVGGNLSQKVSSAPTDVFVVFGAYILQTSVLVNTLRIPMIRGRNLGQQKPCKSKSQQTPP